MAVTNTPKVPLAICFPMLARLVSLFTFSALLIFSLNSHAVAPVILYEKSENQVITSSALIYVDKGGQLSASDIQNPTYQRLFTSRHTNSYLLSDTDSNYWIRFNLFNSMSITQPVVISLSNSFLGALALYQRNPISNELSMEAGGEAKSLPFIEINTKRLNGSFIQANSWLIDLPAKVPQEFLMVVKPEVQSSSTVRVQTLDRYVESEQLMGNIVGFLTGWLLATSLYFAYSFIRYKQQMTLYASLYAVCSAAFVVQLLGYSIIYWDLSANQSILLLRLTILTSLILFMGFVFHAPWSNSRDMDKTKTRLRWFGAIAIVASVFSLTFSPTNAAGIHTQLIISITGITLFILLIQAKTSVPNARLWIFYGVIITAIAPIFSALASSSMMGSNLIPTPWLTLLAPVTVVASMVMTLISIKKNQSKDQGAHGKGVSISPSVLSQISHQLRSPINGIQGMNELLNDTPLTNDQKTFSATIRRSSREVLHVADEISLLAKSTENSPYLTQKNLNLGQLLDTLVEHFQSDAASKDVELIVDRHEFQQQQLLVDGNRTPTLLHNLMAYVLGYIEQGEVALHLTAVSARKGEPGTACIQFQLIGEVSNREQFRHILQNLNKPVYPNNPNTTWSNLVSSNLMQALRAVLEIESLNSTGGSLTLYLPVVPQAFTATTQNVSDDSLLGLSALIVDDNASLRDVVEKQVMRWGVQPHATHSGKDALAIMRNQCALQQPFDVAIIDQQMPIMDGLELARRIREDNGINPKPSILMLTGLSISSVASQAHSLGILHILEKPAKAEQLKQELIKIRVRSAS